MHLIGTDAPDSFKDRDRPHCMECLIAVDKRQQVLADVIGQNQHPQAAPARGDLGFGDAGDAVELAERGEHFALQRRAGRKRKLLPGKQALLRQDLPDPPGQCLAEKIAVRAHKG